MNALLRAKDVTKTYEKAQHPSLNNISFSVAAGEFIGIMGASGSGKTTLLNVLSTIDTPTSGEIWINGINIRQLDNTGAADFRKDHLGFIFQEYFLLDSLTIRENISVPLTLQKLPPPARSKQWCKILRSVSVSHRSSTNIRTNFPAAGFRCESHHQEAQHLICGRTHRRSGFQRGNRTAARVAGSQSGTAHHHLNGHARRLRRKLCRTNFDF